MKKFGMRIMALALAAALVLSTGAFAAGGTGAQENADRLHALGLFQGTGNVADDGCSAVRTLDRDRMLLTDSESKGELADVLGAAGLLMDDFHADQPFTRAMAAQAACRLLLGPSAADALFAEVSPSSDVQAKNRYAGYIAYCIENGMIARYPDGTFLPENQLSGYAFMKLLLCTLGYDALIEQYTGSSWVINVLKRAMKIGLANGLDDTFSGGKPITQREACLMMLNTLKALPVKYITDASGKDIAAADLAYASYAQKLFGTGTDVLTWSYDVNASGITEITYVCGGEPVGTYPEAKIVAEVTGEDEVRIYNLSIPVCQDILLAAYDTSGKMHGAAFGEKAPNGVLSAQVFGVRADMELKVFFFDGNLSPATECVAFSKF